MKGDWRSKANAGFKKIQTSPNLGDHMNAWSAWMHEVDIVI